jgi:NADPH-dependent 2,4-dienoyl-CoA reductase/sulfur reductase-like enzyme
VPDAYDVLVVGGGPAGMAAAASAAERGGRIGVVDENAALGGQIWRSAVSGPPPAAADWLRRVRASRVEILAGACVFDHPAAGLLAVETERGTVGLRYDKLILATGARERFLPFPGWTLPNVCGAGGLQALAKAGLPVAGKRVVVAGSGPLLPAVADFLKRHGAVVPVVAEQAPLVALIRFGIGLAAFPGKLVQAAAFGRMKYSAGSWVEEAMGNGRVEAVRLRRGRKTWTVECDYLACGFHLVPNTELAALLGCELAGGAVRTGDLQETSVAGVYCAGEAAGIGGVDLSLVEGYIAGLAATGGGGEAGPWLRRRARARSFARLLARTFALRPDLKGLPRTDTIVCRCEDVTLEQLRAHDTWRPAKLQTRCGMGPCQGRVCGTAVEFLLGWRMESVRPPVVPVRVDSLIRGGAA